MSNALLTLWPKPIEAGDYLSTIGDLDIYRRDGGEGLILVFERGVRLIREVHDVDLFPDPLPRDVKNLLGLLL